MFVEQSVMLTAIFSLEFVLLSLELTPRVPLVSPPVLEWINQLLSALLVETQPNAVSTTPPLPPRAPPLSIVPTLLLSLWTAACPDPVLIPAPIIAMRLWLPVTQQTALLNNTPPLQLALLIVLPNRPVSPVPSAVTRLAVVLITSVLLRGTFNPPPPPLNTALMPALLALMFAVRLVKFIAKPSTQSALLVRSVCLTLARLSVLLSAAKWTQAM